MSKRLQVLLPEDELKRFQHIARRRRQTLADWVRRALREEARREAEGDPAEKLEAIRVAASFGFPAPELDMMNEEIERGYLAGSDS